MRKSIGMDETNCPCEKISMPMINHIIIIMCDLKTQQKNSEIYIRVMNIR